jgi:hypothetical protein
MHAWPDRFNGSTDAGQWMLDYYLTVHVLTVHHTTIRPTCPPEGAFTVLDAFGGKAPLTDERGSEVFRINNFY